MQNEKVSIIVPVYNVERYIERCIDSLLAQTYSDLEIVIVNDGSTDKSGEICEEYVGKDSRIKYREKKNGGLSNARNTGLEMATGKYVYFIDSDDFINYNTISKMVEMFEDENIDIVSSEFTPVSDNPVKDMEKERLKCEFKKVNTSYFFLQNISNHAAGKMYKRKMYDSVRYPENRNYEDVATTYKLYMKANKIAHTNSGLYYYRMRENTITKTINGKNIKDLYWVYCSVKETLIDLDEIKRIYLLTILYTLYSRALRLKAADTELRRKIEKFVFEEADVYFKDICLERYRNKTKMYWKLVIFKMHLVKPCVCLIELKRRICK